MSDTPLESVVGMQQKTARPKASSGEPKGSRSTTSAARGVMNNIEAKPYRMAPQADSARSASPRRRPSPEMMKMPVVVRLCSPASAALKPGPGKKYLEATA